MRLNKKNLLIKVSCAFILTIAFNNAQAIGSCNTESVIASTPDSRFLTLGDGSEVKDTKTGLTWQRCSLGQEWDGNICKNEASEYTWKEALKEAQSLGSGYHLPNIKELASILEVQCSYPATNQNIFPTPNKNYWTSSAYVLQAKYYSYAYSIDFGKGESDLYQLNYRYLVRAVKSE